MESHTKHGMRTVHFGHGGGWHVDRSWADTGVSTVGPNFFYLSKLLGNPVPIVGLERIRIGV